MNYKQRLAGNSRIKIFVGEFGSGKTELTVNYALKLREYNFNTAVVDIDLVKPYFRTRENRQLLEKKGVLVVAPEQKLAHSDLPIMPQNLTKVLYNQEYQVMMDVGGGDSSIVLGQLNQQLAENSYEAYMVINTRRPFTATAQDIIQVLKRIEQLSRLKITGLISNTNLAEETTVQHVIEGLAIVEEASNILSLPIKWVVVPKGLENHLDIMHPVFVLTPFTQYPWMDQF